MVLYPTEVATLREVAEKILAAAAILESFTEYRETRAREQIAQALLQTKAIDHCLALNEVASENARNFRQMEKCAVTCRRCARREDLSGLFLTEDCYGNKIGRAL